MGRGISGLPMLPNDNPINPRLDSFFDAIIDGTRGAPPQIDPDLDALLGPVGSTMRRYVYWAGHLSDAPSIFVAAAYLTLVSAVLPAGVVFQPPGSPPRRPTLYTLFVGKSGKARKGVAIQWFSELLSAVCPERVGMFQGSSESLALALNEQPYLTVTFPEFTRFLSQSKTGKYIEDVKNALTDYFDGNKGSGHQTVTRGKVQVPDSFGLTLIGGIAEDRFREETQLSDMTGGFFSRWWILYADRIRAIPPVQALDPAVEARFMDYFTRQFQQRAACPPVLVGVTREASVAINKWATDLDTGTVDPIIVPTVERAPTLLLRIASLIALDRAADGQDADGCVITLADAARAYRFVELHLNAVHTLFPRSGLSGSMRSRENILGVIPELTVACRGVPLGAICLRAKVLKWDATRILETLLAEGTVVENKSAGATLYARRPKTPLETIFAGPVVPPPVDESMEGQTYE